MKKRLFTLVSLLLLAAILIGACAQAAPTAAPVEVATEAPQVEKTEAPAEAAPATEAQVVEKPTEVPAPTEIPVEDIELWAGGRVSEAGPPPDDWVAYDVMRESAKVNLELVLLPSTQADQDTKINAAAASNSLPDLFMVSRDVWYKLVKAGLVANVEELLDMMPVRVETHYSDPDRNKLVMNEGQMYGLPDPGALPQTDSLVIRQDWLDKLGLEAPKTTDEFLTVAKAFTFDDPDGNGTDDTYGFCAFIDGSGLAQAGLGPRFDFIYGAYGVAGVWNMTGADNFAMNARDPRFMQATQFIATLNSEKVIDPDWPTLKKDEFRARWKQGKCGIMIENFAALSTKSNYADFDANFPEGEWAAMDAITGPNGDGSMGVVMKTARIYAVSQKAIDEGKGPAIARLLEWMANEEGYYLLGFGVEGVNFVRDENGFVVTTGLPPEQAWTSKEAQPLTQLANMVYVFSEVEMQARYPSHVTANGREIDPKAFYAAFLEQPFTEATGAAIINPPANGADFVRFYSENIVQFVLGQKALDEAAWNEFIAGLDGLGAQDLEATAKQTLIDAGFIE